MNKEPLKLALLASAGVMIAILIGIVAFYFGVTKTPTAAPVKFSAQGASNVPAATPTATPEPAKPKSTATASPSPSATPEEKPAAAPTRTPAEPTDGDRVNSKEYITGPRGGCYYINGNGNKTYVDHSFCGQDDAPSYSAPAPTYSAPSTPTSTTSGATARCRDGSLSYSASRRGTCSHHGGVAVWY